MKKPKFLSKLAAVLQPRPGKKYQATTRAARPQQIEEYDDGQPTTKLSSAFVVVLILHVVAVAGIYAFNSIKASRRSHAQIQAATGAAAGAEPRNGRRGCRQRFRLPRLPRQPAASHAAAAIRRRSAPREPSARRRQARAGPSGSIVVKAGDNVTKIAFAYRITTAELLAANDLKDNSVLRVGQTLTIPASKSDAKTPAADAQEPSTPAKAGGHPADENHAGPLCGEEGRHRPFHREDLRHDRGGIDQAEQNRRSQEAAAWPGPEDSAAQELSLHH